MLLSDRPIPTPAVSWHVRRLGLRGGVAITASHNPARYNGFKVKAHFGGSAPPETYEAISEEADRPTPAPARRGAVETADLLHPYAARLAELVDLPALRGARDFPCSRTPSTGRPGRSCPRFSRAAGSPSSGFRTSRDPLFGGVHPEPIAENMTESAALVRAQGLDLAVAQDGDADRLGVLDEQGRFVSPHQVLALLLLHVFRGRGITGGIAKTFSTSFQIDRIARSLGVPLIETGIGFKYVAELMNRGEAAAGGEESGGYAFAFHLPERDGVLSALLLLESLAKSGQTLGEALAALAKEFGRFEYGRRDVRLPVETIRRFVTWVRDAPPRAMAGEPVTEVLDRDGVKYVFGERGWLLHRLSGTEPLVRLYCEHEDGETMSRILDEAEER